MAKPEAAAQSAPATIPVRKIEDYPPLALGLLRVAHWVAVVGIDKNKTSDAQGNYTYRGIDKVLNDISLPLAEQGITVAPKYTVCAPGKYTDKDGKVKPGLIANVECTITFYDVHGNSREVGPVPGEAYDGMDKSHSKACSVAYRNLMLLTFVAPLGPVTPGGPSYDPEASQEQPSADFPEEEKELPEAERGIKLVGGQLKWLEQRMKSASLTPEDVLKHFPRVDADNARKVGEWISEQGRG
jgi:hypothetical protein